MKKPQRRPPGKISDDAAGRGGTTESESETGKSLAKTFQTLPIVGLGASAGGLQALTDFFTAMPADSGVAFVIIHHADPEHESLMADLLARHTAMPVVQAQDQTQIAPDHVYVIPPNHFLHIANGILRLTDPKGPRGLRLPINYFLQALAEDQHQYAVAVILSGTGSDGTEGIRAVKEQGGMVLVQDPKEATHDGMPRSAIMTGCVDHVLPVQDMPPIISKYARHPYVENGDDTRALDTNALRALTDIISALNDHTPIDFNLYKEGTLLRRIERRMALWHIENTGDYLALLRDSPEEAAKLARDLLISVTSFFRDPEAFDYLAKTVLHSLVANCAPGQPIRVWVPACATGEEVYSLAMLLIEQITAQHKDAKLQIFASDVDEHALSIARAGIYSDAIREMVSPERLDRFFVCENHAYRVAPALRNVIVFANQNVLADAPFSKLDLVSCRNLLIYLNPEAQERLIRMFHFALKGDGVLFLGSSETANGHETYFRAESKKFRVYRRDRGTRHRPLDFPSPPQARTLAAPLVKAGRNLSLAELSQKLLVDRYAPAAVVINDAMETLFVQGPADRYLKVPVGEASQKVLAMARDGMRAQLGSAIREAKHQTAEVTRMGSLTSEGATIPVRIRVHPMWLEHVRLYLVTFADQPAMEPTLSYDDASTGSAAYRQLETELETTRRDLRNTIRDFELSAEELKAANEEAMSMNEEFQSTNEELETSREELQSLNEELTTLNTQLQQKADEERRVSDDLSNLLASSGIATLFLDRQLNIMRFTPAMGELFNLIANDVGRPFSDITGKITDPALLNDAREVIADLATLEKEVPSDSGKWYIRRILPYRTQSGTVDGVVITFLDVTDIKASQHAHKRAQLFAESIVATVREPMLVLAQDFSVVMASQSFHKLFKTTARQIEGKNLFALQNQQWDQRELRRLLERVLPKRSTVEGYQITIKTADQGVRVMVLNARRIEGDTSDQGLILLAIEEMTELLAAQHDLEERKARLSSILTATPEAIITIDEAGIIGSCSPAAEKMLGFTANDMIGQNVSMIMPLPDRAKHDDYILNYITTGERKIIGRPREMNACRKDGSIVPMRLTVAEWWNDGKRHFTGIIQDLTEDMKRREALNRAQKMEAVGQLTGGLAHDFNNLLTIIIGNLELLELQIRGGQQRELLSEALDASNLGAELTAQLLAFSRNQELVPKAVALNDLVRSMRPMVTRTLGKQIKIETNLADDLRHTMTDPGQIESALLNLAINARDAMPNGGTLSISTRNTVLDAGYAATQVDVNPGEYVALSMTDTGHGMTPAIIDRAFEPFFTTKGPGAGSGLGLSMVYGFAKQSGGHVAIYSEVGQGTTITLYLPIAADDAVEDGITHSLDLPRAAGETVLVVEDDPGVRRLTVIRLNELGYKVMAAEDGPTAVDLLKSENDIALVLSDVIMPGGMSGFEVADQAAVINPEVKILLATGYAKGAMTSNAERATRHSILRKPYSLQELAQSLRDLLD